MNCSKDELKLVADTIRTLSMDAVQKANSGHPGMPMGCADIAAVLWCKILKHNPADSKWVNRDRFILSPGHGSMLLYSALHLSGYDVSLDDIKNFRQWESKTPGHPEYGHTAGVETTTGPLGQGFANGIGMGIGREMLGNEFNSGDKKVIDHFVYAIVSDGDLMEGVSYEAASIAGHLGLGNIIYIYDSNDISIEGSTDLTFSDDMVKRFESSNWHVQEINGHDYDEIEESIINAQNIKEKPSIIIAKTIIAKGSPNKGGSESSHGSPLGVDEVKASKINIGWDENSFFHVPDKVYDIFKKRGEELIELYNQWNLDFENTITGDIKTGWDTYFNEIDFDSLKDKLPNFDPEKPVATRSASGKVLEVLFKEIPNLIGGSADLAPSNKTLINGYSESGRNSVGRNIHFGIREHAMGSIQNGLSYYGGFITFVSTFFVFMDYMRPSMRMAALSGLHSIYIFTHDSFFVGEDGPTHQPVEHLAAARAIPNLVVLRPADAEETREAWMLALKNSKRPTMISLTRQNVPVIKRKNKSGARNLSKGAYIIRDTETDPHVIILASGSEVHISIDAADELNEKGIKTRVVSFPSWELFDNEDENYKNKVIPQGIPCVVVEAGLKMGWEKYTGKNALFITMENFGASAPGDLLAEKFGFSKNNIVSQVQKFLVP